MKVIYFLTGYITMITQPVTYRTTIYWPIVWKMASSFHKDPRMGIGIQMQDQTEFKTKSSCLSGWSKVQNIKPINEVNQSPQSRKGSEDRGYKHTKVTREVETKKVRAENNHDKKLEEAKTDMRQKRVQQQANQNQNWCAVAHARFTEGNQ